VDNTFDVPAGDPLALYRIRQVAIGYQDRAPAVEQVKVPTCTSDIASRVDHIQYSQQETAYTGKQSWDKIPTMTAHLEEDWTHVDRITLPVGTITTEETSHESNTYTVTADLLIPGRGEPIKDAGLVIEGQKIKHVCLNADLAKSFSHVRTTHVKVLMPGMWDCHVHLMGEHKVSSDAFIDAWKKPAPARRET
jgi:hypothetical protein